MKKIFSMLLVILLLTSIFYTNIVFAADIGDIESAMSDVKSASSLTGTKTHGIINGIIGIIQVVGTGISLIVISLLGIKYLLASPGEKADVKKGILPIIIGCILLFAGSNIVAVIEAFTTANI